MIPCVPCARMMLTSFSWMPSMALLTCSRSVPFRSILREAAAVLASALVDELETAITGVDTGAVVAAAAMALLCDIGARWSSSECAKAQKFPKFGK